MSLEDLPSLGIERPRTHLNDQACFDPAAVRNQTDESNEGSGKLRLRVLFIALIVALLSYSAGHSKIDDSYIYARYVANALAGHGLVFNIGDHVNALTSPLYAYLLLLVSWLLRGNVLLATVVLSGTFLFLTSIMAERLVAFSGLFIASSAYFYFLVGMETSLFLFMILVVIVLFEQRRLNWLPLACALLILSRFEGGALIVFVAWQCYRRRAWPNWMAFVPAILAAICYLLLNHHYYGAYLPSSATAKLGQGFSGYWGRWPTAFLGHFTMAELPFQKTKYVMYLVAVFSITGIAQTFRSSFSRLVLPFCGALLTFYILLNLSGLYFWYFAPFILFAILYACHAIPDNRVAWITASTLLVLAVLTNTSFLRLGWPEQDRYAGYEDAGNWLAQNTPNNARVEVAEIGLSGWYSNRQIIDVIGLITPKNSVHIEHHDLVSWLAEDRPDYVLVHQPSWIWERVATKSPNYVLLPMRFTGGLVILERKSDYTAHEKMVGH
ncbi:MAG: hypothetical protein ABI158_01030 [Edaphobacter sp.]